MLLAQLTDTHVLDPDSDEERWVDNNARLRMAVDSINAERPAPEVVLATGDLTNDGQQAETDELIRQLDRLEVPVLVLPGNHDDRQQLRVAFDHPWASPDHLSWSVDVGELRIIGLDTQRPGAIGGVFDTEREVWLTGALAEAATTGRPTMIAMHHPPFDTGIPWMDDDMFPGADRFAALIAASPHVGRIVCGHIHRPVQSVVAGVLTTVGLSTVHHVALNLEPDSDVELIRDPAGYQLHRFQHGHWVSHTRYIDTGEVAFRPSWAG
jgi:3',5'-cyclic AMP phosphodiesterase CpdA